MASYTDQKIRFIRNNVEKGIRPTGFPLKACGNDKQEQPLRIVILGRDPGIQVVLSLNTKDTKITNYDIIDIYAINGGV